VEGWFGIVKHILNKKKQMRPGTFLRTMYTSLHGRDIEHTIQHDLPDRLITKPLKPMDIKIVEETWAPKNEVFCSVSLLCQFEVFSLSLSMLPLPVYILNTL